MASMTDECPICKTKALPLGRTGDAMGFDCPEHDKFKVSDTVLSILRAKTRKLIVAPQRGYDEPGILSYAISSFCPTSADGLQRRSITMGRQFSQQSYSKLWLKLTNV